MPSEREDTITRFHARHPGITSRALARTASYERLVAEVRPGARVLDLGCGDGHLVALLAARGCAAVGLDLSAAELAAAHARGPGTWIQGRAQLLPVADRSLDAVVSHLSFMLLDDLDQVAAELARVLVPGGRFAAMLGGGPTAIAQDGDAFHRFLALLEPRLTTSIHLGDRRARSEAGWQELFAGWRELSFERVELDLAGSFAQVWAFLAASYELECVDAAALRAELHELCGEGRVECRAVMWKAVATR